MKNQYLFRKAGGTDFSYSILDSDGYLNVIFQVFPDSSL